MAYADFDYYKNTYLGLTVDNEDAYAYFAERASDELARYAKCLPDTEEAQTALKKCACRVTDILYGDFKSSKNGQKITSESVSGYYTVGYVSNDFATIQKLIRQSVNTYLGKYVFVKVKNIII